ncbi:MAG: sulfatase-like hydrolase/transferase, partial [Oscillospiraceae bacterium]|nr:sulfatase-like hydrolase/transferase [Oscillospiraceae bacterium]
MSNLPNILFIFTDQQRFDTLRQFGNDRIQTPNLDALAADATVFDRCYTPAPVCVPARFSMLSGQYCARSGCCNNNGAHKYQGTGFYQTFTDAGYNTCCVGKMHYAQDLYGDIGFKQRFTQEELSHPDDDYTKFIMESPYRHVFDYNGQRSEMYYIPQISQLPAEYHPTQWVADRSLDFLESVSEDSPFFLMSSFIHPH